MNLSQPLTGQQVLVTRPAGRAGGLRRLLEAAGARVLAVPTTRIVAPSDPRPLDRAVREIGSYDWIVLSSANGVRRLAEVLEAAGRLDALRSAGVAAVGTATARALSELGVADPLVPDAFRGEALADVLVERIGPERIDGVRILLARAQTARPVLRERLARAGADVDDVPAYASGTNWPARERLLEALDAGSCDWLTFTAGSIVRAFVELAGARTGGASVAAIGPVTARAVEEAGLPVHAVAEESTSAGLVRAMAAAAEGASA